MIERYAMGKFEQDNEELRQLKEKLRSERPVSWKEFPDIGLYKDQIVSYMQRQLINFDESEKITSAMINNYIKDKLLPRADGKKYSREHLAGLTEICILKQVLTVRDTGLLLQQELEGCGHEEFYEKFRDILDAALSRTAEKIDSQWESGELSDIALRLAVKSYCEKLAAERLIEIMRSRLAYEELKKQEKKPEKQTKKKQEKQHDSAKQPEPAKQPKQEKQTKQDK